MPPRARARPGRAAQAEIVSAALWRELGADPLASPLVREYAARALGQRDGVLRRDRLPPLGQL